MSEQLFSSSWYRVEGLVPKLRSHARIHRHRYRGRTWYVLQDFSSGKYHRFSPSAYRIIGLIDGTRTVSELWQLALGRLGDDAPTQDEMIRLLAQLHAADVLQSDVSPDIAEVLERRGRFERRQWQSRLMNPFAIRVPLIDPEKILRRFLSQVRPLISLPGLVLWFLVVVPAIVLAGVHWAPLTENVLDQVLTPQNLVLIYILFPFIKAAHEFGHAFVCKAFGGEVHEMGIMFLVLTPVPYVDASSASAFRSKSERALVGAAGMIVEIFVAALAFYVWLNVEPGAVRTVAYNVMIIAGVTTLFFNANPLLRFDGYYILADVIEIPNLRMRSNEYFKYLAERYLFGRREAEPPDATPGERRWFVGYGVASFVYRIFIVVAIMLFILSKFFFFGLLLVAIAGVGWVLVPLSKAISYLISSPRIRRVRRRAIAVCAGGLAAVVVAVGLVPVPLRTISEGVIWVPEEAIVRAGSNGFIQEIVARPGSRIAAGDVLVVADDLELRTEVRTLEWRLKGLEARYTALRLEDKVEAQVTADEISYVERALERARQREADLVVRSQVAGRFVVPVPEDLPGRYARKGEVLGYVVELETITVRAATTQDEIDLVRQRTEQVRVRPVERLSRVIPARLTRIVPTATERLPSSALGVEGGGGIAVDPRDREGATAIQKIFSLEIELEGDVHFDTVGERVYVRFDHGREALGRQWYRTLRQLFLSRFNV
jgi:putative peptide zinc metalloprotease protein